MNLFDVLAAACYLAVVAILAAAAVGKALDPEGTVRGARSLGLPESFSRATSWALPVIEGMLTIGLIAAPRLSSIAAVGLFSAFTITTVIARPSQKSSTCGCFGVLGRARQKPVIVGRNLVFVAAAGLATVADHTSATRLAAGIVVAVSVVICVPLAVKRRRVAGAFDKTPPPAAPVTYALVVEQACPLCDRLLQHLAGILTGKEPLVLVIRGKDSGWLQTRLPVLQLPQELLTGPFLNDVPALLVLNPEGTPIRTPIIGIADVFNTLAAIAFAGVRSSQPSPIEPNERECLPCKAHQSVEKP
ncbi:hypothetical protein ASG92_25045 [Arthrobacter sp. Soil736]|uniref:MauE/DoxX family redox-associated membrane protein n=1 Tax=Arthrobacter sp. Soil736 TaxID=1736395 RepID=UPI00070066AC|nr:MauE/DoxX family redox-associated membrane protein [Arthrobacter sp. Soil736]KRE52939.1 hypothetical protein ASG92_25045 [Arthrobacter sp. Soil736]